jgi:lipoate-protein ligase A
MSFGFADYVFGDRKFGGNAQSIIKNRWIHHTSFLWDYDVRNMAYLKLPSRVPQYRLVCSLFHLDLNVF